MKKFTLLALLTSCAVASPTMAQAPVCLPREDVVSHLSQNYGEEVRGRGMMDTGQMMEVFISEAGTWTITTTTPDGVTCLRAAGAYWEAVSPPPQL
jgi:hypothetical protein